MLRNVGSKPLKIILILWHVMVEKITMTRVAD
jgi:hypothetical protein